MDYPKSILNVGLLNGKFTNGTADGSVKPSRDPAEWANAVSDEILNVIAAGGLTPQEGDNTQLATAIGNLVPQRLPARLGEYGALITDWNTAVKSGFYRSVDGAANIPLAGAYSGVVEALNADWVTQTVHSVRADGAADTYAFRRSYNTAANGWSPWYRLRLSEDELNALYLRKTASTVLEAGFWTKPVALSAAGGTLTPDLAAGNVFTATISAPLTLALPANLAGKAGMFLLVLKQDATGGRPLALAGGYKLAGGAWSTAATAANLLWVTSDGGGTTLDVVIAQRGA